MTTTRTGRRGARALVVLLSAMLLIAALPLNAKAAAFILPINSTDASSWSWPGMAQTFQAFSPITSVSLALHRSSTDTGTFRVEIRTAPGDTPSGNQYTSTGQVLAAKTVSAVGISQDASAPTTVNVTFDSPAMPPSGVTKLALVVIRGTNTGLKWHASTPAGVDQYADGKGWLCVITSCWQGFTPSGAVDFVLSIAGDSALMGSTPRAGVIAPTSPTRSTSGTWRIMFDKPVSGLTASDFTTSGSADGCSLAQPVNVNVGIEWTMAVSGCSVGTLRLTLKAGAVASTGDPSPVSGPFAAVPSAAILRIDRTKPIGFAPKTALYAGAPLSGSTLPLRITWAQASDAGGAGVRRYEISRSTDGGTTWTTLGYSQPLLAVLNQPATGTARFRVRPIDWAGNKGAWQYGPTLRPRLVQQTSSAVTWSSGWATFTDAAYSGGSARTSSKAGAAVKYTFTGQSIGVVMTTGIGKGVAKIYIDGTLKKTIDTSLLPDADQVIVYSKRFSTVGTHTIKVVSGSSGAPNITIDAFVRL